MIIYEIRRKNTGKLYIGYSTKFNSSEEFLNNDYWGSGTYITLAIKKYGTETFERKVLLKNILDFEELKRYETLWIKKKNSKTPNGYNLTDGGDGLINPSKETREKMSKNHADVSGEKNPFFGNHSMSGENSPMSKRRGKNHPNFGKPRDKKTIEKCRVANLGEKNPNFGKIGILSAVSKKVLLISPEGEIFKIYSYTSFCKKNNLTASNLRKVFQGKRKHHKGWTGKYLKE